MATKYNGPLVRIVKVVFPALNERNGESVKEEMIVDMMPIYEFMRLMSPCRDHTGLPADVKIM